MLPLYVARFLDIELSLLTLLGLNLTGAVWTVDQESHNTVTVDFYDNELHRNFHFTDPYRYDKACLSKFEMLISFD
jgi:chromosome transmission fidelity protein 4